MSRDRGAGQECGCGICGVMISDEEGKQRCRCANTWTRRNACYASTYKYIMCPANDNDNINKDDEIVFLTIWHAAIVVTICPHDRERIVI